MSNRVSVIQVLLIENNTADAEILQAQLNELAMATVEIVWVTSLAEGLDQLAQKRYDVVLLNPWLSDSDGIETLTKLRQHSRTIPVVILSGLDDKALALEAVQNGAQDYLVKGRPSGESIYRSIQYAIERRRADDAVMQLQLLEQREHFIAMLAHNLRIPIIGAQRILAILIENGKLPENEKHLLSQISSSNQSLLHMINNALDVYRYEGGSEQFAQSELNVSRLVADCLHEVEPLAMAKNLRVVQSITEQDVIIADPLAMRKVLHNLLNNAVKFTPEGGEVMIRLQNKFDKAILSITDTGVGVEPKDLELIFDRFFQGGKKYRASGLGIGLHLCRRFIEGQKGTIVCISEPNQGTTFEITLPSVPVLNIVNSNFSANAEKQWIKVAERTNECN